MYVRSNLVFVAVLAVFAGFGAWMSASGGFSDGVHVRVEPGSGALTGTISAGEAVDLAAHAHDGGRTVFFFTKPWCGGCWRLAPHVEETVRANDDTTLRVVDIGSWDSAVARQHGIGSTPYLILFEDGQELARGIDTVLDRLGR